MAATIAEAADGDGSSSLAAEAEEIAATVAKVEAVAATAAQGAWRQQLRQSRWQQQ